MLSWLMFLLLIQKNSGMEYTHDGIQLSASSPTLPHLKLDVKPSTSTEIHPIQKTLSSENLSRPEPFKHLESDQGLTTKYQTVGDPFSSSSKISQDLSNVLSTKTFTIADALKEPLGSPVNFQCNSSTQGNKSRFMMIDIGDEITPIEESDSERSTRSSPPIIAEHPSSSHEIGSHDTENNHYPPNEISEIGVAGDTDGTPNAQTVQEAVCPCCGKKVIYTVLIINFVVGFIVAMVWQFGRKSGYFHDL
ncbi:hypothetical protein PGT21_030893 [Puccinia graminis f. sp. tritici]|uniref:LITAF domain-containing protein n=1 Tax=Puccinia graminis f. sp. tritici TaxID=56615 RepID=A0A5B0MRC9_PUCGR|nr:hypothetical protein PGT21_030893 [Puccinia graminis f. sp. tritici]KAA1078556.1 hypothetical protein PGTUg99_012928 [Puccinia graminis f. sp. tritici]KAA1106688.1 hypothetical protein PGTUg99_006103 [Puccinia graminis f. sp. tritici]